MDVQAKCYKSIVRPQLEYESEWPDRVSNSEPLALESDALSTASGSQAYANKNVGFISDHLSILIQVRSSICGLFMTLSRLLRENRNDLKVLTKSTKPEIFAEK